MALSDFQIFNDFLYTTVTETLDQQINLFNAATQGAIVLRSGRNVGDYVDEVFYKAFSAQARRRDAYASGAVAAQDLSQETMTKVKVGGANGPFAFSPSQFTWIQKNPEEAALVIGEQVTPAILQDYLNAGVSAARAAILNQGSLEYDGSAGTMGLGALNTGAALFGDASGSIVAWVMHSKPYHDLLGSAITNSNTLFEYGNLNIVSDNVGRPIIVSDIPSLLNTVPTPDEYTSLGLSAGGIVIEDNGDFFSNTETNNGDVNIGRTWQSEYTFSLGIKGYSWDKANGGKSPTDAELATGTNWDQVASFDKETAGVAVVTQ
jgi:hypothetical protein